MKYPSIFETPDLAQRIGCIIIKQKMWSETGADEMGLLFSRFLPQGSQPGGDEVMLWGVSPDFAVVPEGEDAPLYRPVFEHYGMGSKSSVRFENLGPDAPLHPH